LRESEYNRGTGCGKTARPGLCGGLLVTGVPTARGVENWKRITIVNLVHRGKLPKSQELLILILNQVVVDSVNIGAIMRASSKH
jgi:hypothetical protein